MLSYLALYWKLSWARLSAERPDSSTIDQKSFQLVRKEEVAFIFSLEITNEWAWEADARSSSCLCNAFVACIHDSQRKNPVTILDKCVLYARTATLTG